MANGGWYGTKEEWDRLEAPLKLMDADLESFSHKYNLSLTKNLKDWPERSFVWGSDVRCLIQIYLADKATFTWNLWLCAFQERNDSRFWKQEMLCSKVGASDIAKNLFALLESGKLKLDEWSARPETLEFAVKRQS